MVVAGSDLAEALSRDVTAISRISVLRTGKQGEL
jgi:hypothetical protein